MALKNFLSAVDDHVERLTNCEILMCYLRRLHEHACSLYNAKFYKMIAKERIVRSKVPGFTGEDHKNT